MWWPLYIFGNVCKYVCVGSDSPEKIQHAHTRLSEWNIWDKNNIHIYIYIYIYIYSVGVSKWWVKEREGQIMKDK